MNWFASIPYLFNAAIKRELGVNPRQSRCCEALYQTFRYLLLATNGCCMIRWEGTGMEAKSEDLPFIKSLLSRGLDN